MNYIAGITPEMTEALFVEELDGETYISLEEFYQVQEWRELCAIGS